MEHRLEERIGTPFVGKEKEKLARFLKEQELSYDENITWTILFLDGGKIAATGSCHGNVMKCIAVAKEYQGHNLLSLIMTRLIERFYSQGISHYFGFTKPKNKDLFCSMGLYPVAETEQVLLLENKRNGLKRYVEKIKKETEKRKREIRKREEGDGIGAIVANCNPFTLGHQYLMEKAAAECQYLHVFILSEEQGIFSAGERFDMVKNGVAHISNIILHQTSDYLISPAVFPTYFIKEKEKAFGINCQLDIEIFGSYIAKELKITKRYVGSEPECRVTGQYNEILKKELPKYQIEVRELPRYEVNGMVVSASKVRKDWKKGRWENVAMQVPKSTWEQLRGKKNEDRECDIV